MILIVSSFLILYLNEDSVRAGPMVTVTSSFSLIVPAMLTAPTAKISRLAAFRTPVLATNSSPGV